MIEITREDFSVDNVIKGIKARGMGAVVTFLGVVRDHSRGRDVKRIEIQVYEEMARSQLEEIREEALERFNVEEVAIVHRYGSLRVSENIMMIAVGAGHREEAFEACRYILEAVKERVPIWKKEFTPEGEFWIEGEEYERA
ncbi:MAG: molybdenum cofactor biosynthesis protein MoaE [Candidatus Bathyarchaeota archaeon]|jgi:molybdopterin synthase catalytic subunit